ncbi:uncharacterized protein F4807DRAFT_432828 [Annulohypoxylon truncatum]|uniref:uncharacterized protein n=1 Tax=Annulohypoxylon truncatum TaxID=327061 RepID=UPI00200772BB|nr:uncharacterized protein F4807DRAFT_432828 [Annulohypoxylon truncatum]KAI1208013.1 hypothetical protein F4807DRAFT_432828 [Annulohypoxylon truncatum]
MSMSTRTESKRRTKEWFDRQPRPVAFPQIIDLSNRQLESKKNICSTDGVELNWRFNSASSFLEAIPSHLFSKTSGVSILNKIQEEADASSNPIEQDDKVKQEHQLPCRGGLQVIRHHAAQCQSGSPAETSTTSSQPSQNLLGLSQTRGNRYSGSRKRKTGGGNSGNDPGDDSDDDSDDEDPRRPRPSSGKGKATDTPFLACPYFKHDPRKYVGREWRSCCGPGWDSVHRMKEHLYKHHRQPKFRCKRCGENFKRESYLDNHMREAEVCILQDLKPLDGFDSKQEAKLRSRKKPKPPIKLSESDKWRQTYKILFPLVPDAEIPSPFYEYTGCLPNSINDYKEFVQREILGRLRDRLEHDFETLFNIVDNSSKQKALEWYLSTHLELIQSYQDISQSGSSLPSTFTNPSSPTMVTTDLPTPQFLGDVVQQHPNTQLAFSSSSMATDNDVLFKDSDFLELTDMNSYDPCEFTIEESHEKGATRHNDSAYESMSAKQSIRHLPG